jgi:hypothetical protein
VEKVLFYPTPTREKAVSAEYRVPFPNDIIKIIIFIFLPHCIPSILLKKKLLSGLNPLKLQLPGVKSAISF